VAEEGMILQGWRTVPVVRTRFQTVLCRACSCAILAAFLVAGQPSQAEPQSFEVWLEDVKAEAAHKGLTGDAVSEALVRARYLDRVLELDRRQPELTQTFWKYIDARITPERVANGQGYLYAYESLLNEVYQRYGVQPRVLVALWGLESDYGRSQGDFEVVSGIATLAFDSRRSSFFRQQLFALLELMQRGDVPFDVAGSWAGAIGQPQFMPTTFRDHAVDFDGDGRRDLRDSLPDIFASAASYLAASGWNRRASWGHEVSLPEQFDYTETGLEVEKPVYEWKSLGVRGIDRADLADSDMKASLLLPAGAKGPAFLTYRNFRAILRWNNSVLYALAVGHLSDRLAGGGPLLSPRPAAEVPLSHYDVVEMQSMLTNLGFEPGEPDGVVGEKTRRAIRMFQKSVELPADGYPDPGLLERLRVRSVN
jgi:membrane-bound lytic murein transglycosylase B